MKSGIIAMTTKSPSTPLRHENREEKIADDRKCNDFFNEKMVFAVELARRLLSGSERRSPTLPDSNSESRLSAGALYVSAPKEIQTR